ncbi:MAG: hypothetical protein V7637_5972, partial [Mycobacteriales bacterium]
MAGSDPAFAPRLVERLISSPTGSTSLAGRARQRRWAEFHRRFPDLAQMRVLDLGGVPAAWQRLPQRPAEVVLVNLLPQPVRTPPWLVQVEGDACQLPDRLRRERFDLVYSNSVLEHVGGHARRQAFAETVHAAAGRHWVQTPYRYFPIEPHWLFPGFQFIPPAGQAALSQWWPFGHIRSADRRDAVAGVLAV